MQRLNLGCGPVQPEGWANVDPDPRWGAQFPHPLRECGFAENTFDLVVANHVLMMIPFPELLATMTEVHRVLVGGGVLRIIEPDLIGAFEAFLAGNADHFPIPDQIAATVDGKLCLYVTQAGATRSVFTYGFLVELCKSAGFRSVVEVEAGTSTLPEQYEPTLLDSRPLESIFVEARK